MSMKVAGPAPCSLYGLKDKEQIAFKSNQQDPRTSNNSLLGVTSKSKAIIPRQSSDSNSCL